MSTGRIEFNEATDDQLMRTIAEGDNGAFGELVHRYQNAAWKTAYRYLRDSMEAEDAAQETFLKIFGSAHRYQSKGSFRNYFYSILIRTCVDHYRKRRPEDFKDFSELPDLTLDPAEKLMDKERDEQVRKALDALPASWKAALILRHYEGLSYAEIAQILGVSLKAVERITARARASLQARLSHL